MTDFRIGQKSLTMPYDMTSLIFAGLRLVHTTTSLPLISSTPTCFCSPLTTCTRAPVSVLQNIVCRPDSKHVAECLACCISHSLSPLPSPPRYGSWLIGGSTPLYGPALNPTPIRKPLKPNRRKCPASTRDLVKGKGYSKVSLWDQVDISDGICLTQKRYSFPHDLPRIARPHQVQGSRNRTLDLSLIRDTPYHLYLVVDWL